MPAQTHTSFRLSPEARQQLARLASRYGISMKAVLEMLIRERARREKLGS